MMMASFRVKSCLGRVECEVYSYMRSKVTQGRSEIEEENENVRTDPEYVALEWGESRANAVFYIFSPQESHVPRREGKEIEKPISVRRANTWMVRK